MQRDERSGPTSGRFHVEKNWSLPAGSTLCLEAYLPWLHLVAPHKLQRFSGDLPNLIETIGASKIKANNSIFQMSVAFRAIDDNARLDRIPIGKVLLKLPRQVSNTRKRVKERKVTVLTCTPGDVLAPLPAEAELKA
jgi:hypothetical protein